MAPKQQLQTTGGGNTALASQELANLFAQDANLGLQNLGKQDLSTPFLNVIQALSPQRQRGHEKFITGAEEGMIFNSVTGELFNAQEQPILFIPVSYEMVYNVWVDRKQGQGFVGTYKTRAEAESKAAEDARWQVVDTHNHYVLYFSPIKKQWSAAILSCTSTKLKVSRDFNTKLTEIRVPTPQGPKTPPRFATVWNLGTVMAKKDQHTFFNIKIWPAGPDGQIQFLPDAQMYETAKATYQAWEKGEMKVDYAAAEEAAPAYDDATVESLDENDDEPKF